MESAFIKLAVPSRCTVRSGTAGAGAQSSKPAKEQKVQGWQVEAVGQPPVKLQGGGRSGGGRLLEETSLDVADHLHHSPGPLRARRVHLCRRSFKPDPDRHDGGDQISGARRWIHMGQKAF